MVSERDGERERERESFWYLVFICRDKTILNV
jgi:hypothetical protein